MVESLAKQNAKHIRILNDEVGEVRESIADLKNIVVRIETDVTWLKRNYWLVASASVGAIIVGIIK
jgi:hypothetical protein